MKKILFLVYVVSVHANEQGCTIPFFTKGKSPCSAEKKQIIIAPIVIEHAPEKKSNDTKKIEGVLRTILKDVKQYKNKSEREQDKLAKELSLMKKKFHDYKIKKDKELKKVKKKLYIKNQKEHEKIKKLKKELYLTHKKEHEKVKKLKKELYLTNKKGHEKIKKLKKELYVTNKKLDNNQIIIIESIKKQPTVIHKVIREMQSVPTLVDNTPWIEITVEDNINIYDLALKYYGDSQEYTKIYSANKNVINSNYQINNGMSLIIPITENFQEQPILLNRN